MSDKTDDNKSIPKTMSTQHPDNANVPTWSDEEVINGNLEVFEASTLTVHLVAKKLCGTPKEKTQIQEL